MINIEILFIALLKSGHDVEFIDRNKLRVKTVWYMEGVKPKPPMELIVTIEDGKLTVERVEDTDYFNSKTPNPLGY